MHMLLYVHTRSATVLPGTGHAISLRLHIVFQTQVAPGLANRLAHTDNSKVVLEGVEGAAALIAAAMRHAPPSRSRYPRVPAARQDGIAPTLRQQTVENAVAY